MIDPQIETPDEQEPEAQNTERDRDSRPWLAMIADAQRCFEDYHRRADNIDMQYANLKRLAEDGGEREMQIFWANLEVLKPSIYAREPIPVVTPRFHSRNPVQRKASEVLERALISNFEIDHFHETMIMVRDDVATVGRGAVWLSVQVENDTPRVACEHVERCDFLHGPARKWSEVPWVARRVHLNRKKMKARFGETAPAHWYQAAFEARALGGDKEDQDWKGAQKTAEIWEIWHREENVVCWVAQGVEEVLDIQEPFLDVEGFFPCPRPAYGTLQRGTLLPVPDFAYYKDQLEEINELTARISALSEALIARGFYPQGQGDIGEAIEMALASQDKRQLLIGIPSLQAFSSGAGGKLVEMWPVEQVAATVAQLIELRRQLIDDVYQISGISDIMRGETEASETATAQNIKAQYGNVRVRSRQEEMTRIARDVVRLQAEIMAEQFDMPTILNMSQVDDIPSAAQLQPQMFQLQAAAQQGDPNAAQQLQSMQNTVTVEAIQALFHNQRTRPFALEIETDSTIQPNEDAEKQRRTEFVATVGGLAQQALPMAMQFPQSTEILVEILKFAAEGFRAGRDLSQTIEEFGEEAKRAGAIAQQKAEQPTPEQEKMAAETQKISAEAQKIQAETGQGDGGAAQAEMQLKAQMAAAELQQKAQMAQAELALKREEMQMRFELDRERLQMEFALKRDLARAEMEMKREQTEEDMELKRETASAQTQIAAQKAKQQSKKSNGAARPD